MGSSLDPKSLERRARELASSVGDLLQLSSDPQSSLSPEQLSSLRLAHYTSLDAIVSMLQRPGDGLRLSDSSIMNDPDEGRSTSDDRFFVQLLKKEFGKKSWLWKRYSNAKICCFVGVAGSDNSGKDPGNDLLFWRLYGNDCRGVSITIPPHKSQELLASCVVQPVEYFDEPPLGINLVPLAALLRGLDDLRSEACESDKWPKISSLVLPAVDRLLKQRFLRKRSYYQMESEYRAVAFHVGGWDGLPSLDHGLNVRYNRARTFVQVPSLRCESIFTTGSRITIGSNVPQISRAKKTLSGLLENQLEIAPGVVAVRESGILYRPR